ncbi:MAG TPA: hypothetical protein VLH41_00170 [Thermoanaerobaculia bacterium]|nr:hypothetical protein [Thermoanaerobaculia bacterium]
MPAVRDVPILFLAASAAVLAAPDARTPAAPSVRVEAGDPSVSGSFLHPYTNRWKFFIQKKGGEPVEAGTWSDALEATSYEGRPALRRTQVAQYKKGIRLTFVNVFDARTMTPYTADYERSDTGETRHAEFRQGEVSFRRLPGTGDTASQQYVASLDHRVLDFYDGMYGVLLDAFPLGEGYAARFPAFDSDTASVDWIDIRVTGRETVAAGPGRRADTWVVHAGTKKYGQSTWWLTRQAPYVIKAELILSEEAGGAKVTYEMI